MLIQFTPFAVLFVRLFYLLNFDPFMAHALRAGFKIEPYRDLPFRNRSIF